MGTLILLVRLLISNILFYTLDTTFPYSAVGTYRFKTANTGGRGCIVCFRFYTSDYIPYHNNMTFDRREAITKLLEAVNYKIEEIRNSAIESFF
jgi:hypothetical protein